MLMVGKCVNYIDEAHTVSLISFRIAEFAVSKPQVRANKFRLG